MTNLSLNLLQLVIWCSVCPNSKFWGLVMGKHLEPMDKNVETTVSSLKLEEQGKRLSGRLIFLGINKVFKKKAVNLIGWKL